MTSDADYLIGRFQWITKHPSRDWLPAGNRYQPSPVAVSHDAMVVVEAFHEAWENVRWALRTSRRVNARNARVTRPAAITPWSGPYEHALLCGHIEMTPFSEMEATPLRGCLR